MTVVEADDGLCSEAKTSAGLGIQRTSFLSRASF